jgi:Protein of unknown function (DUF3553)
MMQNKFKAGDRIRNAKSPEWGLGEVLADEYEGKVDVFFEDKGVVKLQLEDAKIIRVFGEDAESDFLVALITKYKAGQGKRLPLGKQKPGFIPFPKAVQNFLSYFPNGFMDPKYLEGGNSERAYKLSASKSMREALGRDIFSDLLGQGKFEDICDRAKSVVNKTNLIDSHEKMALADGLATEEHQKRFAESLWALLYSSDQIQPRFKQFADTLVEINAAKWPIATYFLFITFPDDHMFLKPEVTKNAANVLGTEINYRPELNWLTYSLVLKLAKEVRDKLVKDGRPMLAPRDMIDVQSFIWVTAPGYYV